MKTALTLCFSLCTLAISQNLPARWDELTATDWPKALEKSKQTCILPIGILEKHGPHVPIGSDLIQVREWAKRATAQEYAVVFPDYFYGQIYEAKHQPGAFALPSDLVWRMLDETCKEIARNGFTKIVIINGHGGNPYLLRYFVQSQLERRRNYVVYYYDPAPDSAFNAESAKMRKSDPSYDGHAGERETSALLYLRPELVQMENAEKESGKNQRRLSIPDVYTGIGWYASYPGHYAGEGSAATRQFGQFQVENRVSSLVRALSAIKSDKKALELQNEFFDRIEDLNKK